MSSFKALRRIIKGSKTATGGISSESQAEPDAEYSAAVPRVLMLHTNIGEMTVTRSTASMQDSAEPSGTRLAGARLFPLLPERMSERANRFLEDIVSSSPANLLDRIVGDVARLPSTANGVATSNAELRTYSYLLEEVLQSLSESVGERDTLPGEVNLRVALEELRDIATAAADRPPCSAAPVKIDILRIQQLQNCISAARNKHDIQALTSLHAGVRQINLRPVGEAFVLPAAMACLPPPPTPFHGRDEEVKALVKVILESDAARTCLRGSAGIGKSTLALRIMHDPQIESKFGRARLFVRLDPAKTADDILAAIAQGLGIFGKEMCERVFNHLQYMTVPWLLTLDNFESPWDSKERHSVEAFLLKLANLRNLTLIVTLRGTELPSANMRWTHPLPPPVAALSAQAAQDVLWSIAQCRGPAWSTLLAALDHVPLAITLVAQLARWEQPEGLLQRWQTERTTLLKRSSYSDRASSVNISIQLSLISPRMMQHPFAVELLSLLSLLPDGMPEREVVPILQEVLPSVWATLSVLYQVALTYKDEQGTVRVLSPIRAFMQHHHQANTHLQKPIISHYLAKAIHSAEVQLLETSALVSELAAQIGNIEAILSLALETAPSTLVLDAVIGFGWFTAYTSLGGTAALERAVSWLKDEKHHLTLYCAPDLEQKTQTLYRAHCLDRIGEICLQKGKLDEATGYYTEALKLFKAAQELQGQGRCLFGVARLHLQRSQLDEGSLQFTEALQLFRASGDTDWEANCLKGIGDIYLRRAKLSEAHDSYAKALLAFRAINFPVAQAACLRSMGDICLRECNLDGAISLYSQALAMFKAAGDSVGQGNCLESIGNIQLQRSQLDEALQQYQEGLKLFKAVNQSVGQGNCLRCIGLVHLRRFELNEAFTQFTEALQLFRAAGHAQGEGNCLEGLAGLHVQRSEFSEAIGQYDKALEIFRMGGEPLGHANCLKGLGDIYLQSDSDLDKALGYYTEAMELFRSAGDILGHGNSLMSIVRIHLRVQKLDRAHESSLQALGLFMQAGDPVGQGNCITQLASIHWRRNELDDALRLYNKALELFRTVGEPLGEGQCMKGIGDVYRKQGGWDRSFHQYTQALQLFRTVGELLGQGNCLKGLGDLHLERLELDDAQLQYTLGLDLFKSAGSLLNQGRCLEGLADVHHKRGSEQDQALTLYAEALHLFISAGDPIEQGNCLKSMGYIHYLRGELNEAIKHYKEAQSLFGHAGAPLAQAHCLKGIGNIQVKRAKLEDALIHYAAALQLYREVGECLGQAYCLLDLGKTGRQLPDYNLDEAVKHYNEALDLFSSMDDPLGQGPCLIGLGDIHCARGEQQDALDRYIAAFDVLRATKDLIGQGNSLMGIGHVCLQRDELDEALGYYVKALDSFRAADEPLGQGNSLKSIGVVHLEAGKLADAQQHFEKALQSYKAAGLPDNCPNVSSAVLALQLTLEARRGH